MKKILLILFLSLFISTIAYSDHSIFNKEKANQIVEEHFKNGDTYVGSVQENQMHGQGKMTFATGGHYIGRFANNHFHGEGVLATPEKVHAGRWDNGIFLD